MIAALQVWGGLVLPLLAAAADQNRGYRRYRYERLLRLLRHERAEFRADARRWTRAAAAARREAAEAVGFPVTDLGSSNSSGPSSPESAAEAETVAAQAAVLVDAPSPPGLLARGDWQYEAAHRALLCLRALWGWAALPAATAICLLYGEELTKGGACRPAGRDACVHACTTGRALCARPTCGPRACPPASPAAWHVLAYGQ